MIRDYFFMSFRNLRRRGLRSWLTLIGILIGIAAVVSLITIGNGLREAVNSQFGISSTEVISVQAGGLNSFGPPGSGAVNPLTVQDSEAIERLSSVEYAIPRNIESVRVEFNDKLLIGLGVSLPKGDKRKFVYELMDLEIESGRFLDNKDSGKVLLGNDFSDKTKSGFDKAVRIGDSLSIEGKNFEVAGIFKKKGSFIFDQMILVDNDELKNLLDYGDEVSVIGVKVKNKDLMDRAKEDIEDLLRKRRDVKRGEEDFEVSTPQATLETVNQVLLGVQIFIVLIAFISIIVGAVGIVNTMTTSVLERKKEIGIMKAIGARNSDIFYQFLIEAGMMGLIGGVIGIILGVSMGFLGINAINNFIGATTKPQINFWLIGLSLMGSFFIGAISGIVPALNAARQNPVDALRG